MHDDEGLSKHQQLTNLRRLIHADDEQALDQFRATFFEHLERRDFAFCRQLVDTLVEAPSTMLSFAGRHYLGVLIYSETRQLDIVERMFRDLLKEPLSAHQKTRTLLALAILLDEQGQWQDAERVYQQALDGYARLQDDLGRCRTLNNLGISVCYQVEQGACPPQRLDEAVAYHRQALELATHIGNDEEIAKNWHGLGKAYGLQKRFDTAHRAFARYLSFAAQMNNPHWRAYTLTDLAALVFIPQKLLNQAADALDEAIRIHSTLQEDLDLAEALMWRGHVHEVKRELADALTCYMAAVARMESIRRRLTAPTVVAANRATAERIYASLLTYHLRQGDAIQAFNTAERTRARVLADQLASRQVPARTLPKDLLQRRAELCATLDDAYAGYEIPSSDIPDLEAELAALDRTIDLHDPNYAALDSASPVTANEVQRLLPEKAALLSYVTDVDSRFWAIVVHRRTIDAVLLPEVTTHWLEGYLLDHLDGTRRGVLVPEPGSGRLHAPQRLLAALQRALLAPVMPLLNDVDTVYVVPTGPMYYIPFAALAAVSDAAPNPKLQERRVVYAPSATILMTYCHAKPPSSRRGVLAVAPDDDILQKTQAAARRMTPGEDDAALCGEEANRLHFLHKAGHHSVLCFLGHAHFDRRYPMASQLILTDGPLRAGELLRELQLEADLVVLAACESGRSQVLRGDELIGLARALFYAGTPALLVTLWPVLETPTLLLIDCFMRKLRLDNNRDTATPANALIAAQAWLRTLTVDAMRDVIGGWSDRSPEAVEHEIGQVWHMIGGMGMPAADDRLFAHPYFWSSFILVGDWKPSDITERNTASRHPASRQ